MKRSCIGGDGDCSDSKCTKAEDTNPTSNAKFSPSPTLELIRKSIATFAAERDWDQFHTPRNLLLALVGEVGEVSELFQWRGEVKAGLPDWSDAEKEHLGQELSDVLLYLVRIADRCDIDLPKAVEKKMELNRKKYPAYKVYGKSRKYTEYQNDDQNCSKETSDDTDK